MAFKEVKQYFEQFGMGQKVLDLDKSSATVEEAARAIGCEPCQIAKTMSFLIGEKPILIVTAGDARIDNKKYKTMFHKKAKMVPVAQVEKVIGHAPGGVCPFVIHPEVTVYLDISLKRFHKIYPAAGSDHSAVDLSLEELETYSHFTDWVDVCKDWGMHG